MAIKTVCPHCSQSYSLADAQLGKTVRCKSCSEPFVVKEARAPRRRDEEETEERSERPARQRKKGLPGWVWVVGGLAVAVLLLGCLGVGGGLLWYFGRSNVTEENYAKLKVGMSEADVKTILGNPDAVEDVDEAAKMMGVKQKLGLRVLVWKNGKNQIDVTFQNGKAVRLGSRFQLPGGGTKTQSRNM